MNTLQEVIAKVGGLDQKIAALETDKAKSATDLAAALAAKAVAESQLAQATAQVTALTGEVATLKAKAGTPPPPDPEEEKAPSDAAQMLDKVLEFIKTLLGKTDPADTDAKADDDADAADDTEAKALLAKGKKAQALTVKAKTVQRRITSLNKRVIPVAQLPLEVTKQIAALGIPLPVATRKDGAAGNTLEEKRAQAKSAWFQNISPK